MDWKAIVKPLAKFGLKFGLNYGLERAAKAAQKKPEKAGEIVDCVTSLGTLVTEDAVAIKDGNYDAAEKAASDAKVDVFVDQLFAF